MGLTRQQQYSTVTASVCSSLSVVGSVYILGRYWYVRCMRARAARSRNNGGGVRRVDVTQELIHVLAWLDLIGAFGRGFGALPTATFDQVKGEPTTVVCKLQAFAISFSDVSAIMWNFLMAFNLFRWVCLGEDQQRLQKTIKWYVCGTLMFAATVTGLALGANVYGDAHVWCWISIPKDKKAELYWKLGSLYVWIIILALAMIVLLILVKMNVQQRLEGVDNEDARVAYKGVVQTLTIYISAFIICWIPPIVNRVNTYVTGKQNFTLMMLQASIVSIQGFLNAVIYGKFHVWMARHLVAKERYDDWLRKGHKSTSHSTPIVHFPARNEQLDTGIATIFMSAFDMNWSSLPPNLDRWIPRGKDVYAFTLQHCTGVQNVEHAIREHLLRVNFPMGYRSITSLEGTVSRGNVEDAALCQMIFVNNSDVASGNFQFQSADGRQWAQRKAIKNVLGIPIRYFDASIAFVSCNLRPSSALTSNQAPQKMPLAAKHAATSTLIRSLTMGLDRSTVDFPHLYHHTFLSGDLNYAIAKPQPLLSAAIDQAYRAECLKRATESATQTKLQNSRETRGRSNRTAVATFIEALPAPAVKHATNSNYKQVMTRASMASDLSDDGDDEYEVVFSSSSDGMAFTQLRSPVRKSSKDGTAVQNSSASREPESEVSIGVFEPEHSATQLTPSASEPMSWWTFLESMFWPKSSVDDRLPVRLRQDSYESLPSPLDRNRSASSWIRRSQFAAECSQSNWQELLQRDELRSALRAREVLCGFEEPPIGFLPSYPRRVGASASYSMTSRNTCKELFEDGSTPAYADRILTHSLPDARQRLRNVEYWICEDVSTSTHKPVCSLYELEVDRFFAYKNSEATQTDVQAGKVALRDKTDVQEFKIKLVNLDANMWTYQPTHRQSMNPLRRLRSPSLDLPHAPSPALDEPSRSPHEMVPVSSGRSPQQRPANESRRSMSTRLLDSRSRSSLRRSRRESMDSPLLELVSIEPSHIATIFPLPSEDVYALQRKVYEVAHSVQKGFLSSSLSSDAEESSLAFTNSRTVTWKEATAHGVMHSAIAKPVNGVLHIAINVQGNVKGQGGQGILCINETDLLGYDDADAELDPIPFDIPLTLGGKHVGYLHGDIVRGL